jgi:hypothetical protein
MERELIERIYNGHPIKERYNLLFDENIHERINWDTLAFRDIPSSLLSDKKTHWAIWEYIEERDGLIIYRTENVGMLVQFAKYASGIFKIETIIF